MQSQTACHININYISRVSHEISPDPDKWLKINTQTRSSPFVSTLCMSVVVTNEWSDPLEKKGTYGQRRSINNSPEEATGSYLSIPVYRMCVCVCARATLSIPQASNLTSNNKTALRPPAVLQLR